MAQHNIYSKVGLAAFLQESGIPLIDFQKVDSPFCIMKNFKTQKYSVIEFDPKYDLFKRGWRSFTCLQVALPAWMKSYDDFSKSKRIRLREVTWAREPNSTSFESHIGSWMILN